MIHSRSDDLVQLQAKGRSLLFLASLPLLSFLVLPLIVLIARNTPAAVAAGLADPVAGQALWLSCYTTLAATAVTLASGTPLAYLLARKSFPGRRLLEMVLDLPVVLPPAVAGICLLLAFGRRGLFGPLLESAGWRIPYTQVAVIMAQIFVAAPLYIKAAAAGFAGVDRDFEQAAAIDGASPWRIFRTVTLPLAYPSVISGAVMTWARALGEFGATIIFAGNFPGRTQTMPLAIYMGFEIDISAALTLAVILLAVSFIVLAIVRRVP